MRDEAKFREAERRLWGSLGVAPEEKRVVLKRTGVGVRVQELGEGPPVLLLHGASSAGSSWADLVVRLQDFRCLMVDKPGTGSSDPFPQRFDFPGLQRFAEDYVSELLDGLGLDSAHVVATSYGGHAALHSAAAHPERIRRMMVFGWATGMPTAKMPLLMKLATIPALGRAMTRMPAPEAAVRSMFKQIGLREALAAGRVSQEAIDWFRALLNHTDTMRNEIEIGPRLITMKGMDERVYMSDELLRKIETPIYFLWGEGDPFGTPEIARRFVSKIPNAELEILPGTGHAVWMDDPDKAASVTGNFLRR